MVAGKRIDDARAKALLQGMSLVIAHNAEFDRPFLEQRLPFLARLPWACSLRQVPWSDEGFGAAGLEHLACRRGFFFDAHRSEIDCRALLEVLRRPLLVSGKPALKRLLERAQTADWRLYALASPFGRASGRRARSSAPRRVPVDARCGATRRAGRPRGAPRRHDHSARTRAAMSTGGPAGLTRPSAPADRGAAGGHTQASKCAEIACGMKRLRDA